MKKILHQHIELTVTPPNDDRQRRAAGDTVAVLGRVRVGSRGPAGMDLQAREGADD